MLWMLEKNPNLRKTILCLDHDTAGIEAVGRLSDVLREHGYSQIAPLQSEYKDWDEDLKARHGLEAQPAEEHPQFAVAGLVCQRIGTRCKEVQPDRAAYQIPGLLLQYRNDLHWGRFDQAMEHMETMAALEKYHIKPDTIIGCAGGGSNLGGLISPFVGEMLRGEADYKIIAVEPASCPSLTRGKFAYDFCDTGMVCPLAKMYTLGSGFIPSAIHAGGLRYHGMSPILSQLYHDGLMEARSVEQTSVFEAAEYFARTEGILPAPESSHAIRAAIDEALKCKETGEEKTIVFGLTGTGYFDLVAYQKFNDHEMTDTIPTDEQLAASIAQLPKVEG